MAGMTNSEFYEVSKAIFCDRNVIKYFSMVCHHYRIESGSKFSEIYKKFFAYQYEDQLLEINNILSTVCSVDENISQALTNKYMVSMFFLSICTIFERLDSIQLENTIKKIMKTLDNSPIKNHFNDFCNLEYFFEYEDQQVFRKKNDNLEVQEEKIIKDYEKTIKDYKEKLKNANITISKLEDEIQELEQRIGKGKEIWEENKRLKEIIKNEVPEPFYTNIINKLTQARKLAKSNESKPVSTSLPNQENNSMPKLSLPSNNPLSSQDEEQMDYTRQYAHAFRDHGQFGSHPSHDDFGDESVP